MRTESDTESSEDFFTKRALDAGRAGAREAIAELLKGVEPRTWFSAQKAAAYCGYSEAAFCRWCKDGTGPRSVLHGRNNRRYKRQWLDEWMLTGPSAKVQS